MPYLRVTLTRWNIDLGSEEAHQIFLRIEEEGLQVLKAQPGFLDYRLMRADNHIPHLTISIIEWESEELGVVGAQKFRQWLKDSGLAEKLSLDTYDGDLLLRS